MLSMISHQWRQPLATINSVVSKVNVKMELKALKKSDIISSNEKILTVTNHLNNTINDFKNFYKKDKQKKTFDLKECINSALKIIEGNFEKNRVLLKTDLENDLKIHSHMGELQQVILVIVNNAIDAMENLNENRTKQICISSENKNGNIKISIKDTADGIPQIMQDRIFEPYFSTKLEKNGSGLGLYMAKMIVDKTLKGELNFSTSKKGTTFTLLV